VTGSRSDSQDEPDLEPFFGLDAPHAGGAWSARPHDFARNHMGTVHGGALCLLVTEIAWLAFRRSTRKDLDAFSLAISFLRPVEDTATIEAVVDDRPGAGCVSLLVRSANRVCSQATVVGVPGAVSADASGRTDGAPAERDIAAGLPPPAAGGVPFRDTLGVQVRASGPRSLVARWAPSDRFRAFGSRNGRVLGIAAALVDTGGSLVNAGPEGRLVTRYVTASIAVSLFDRSLDAVRGPASIDEVGDGRRIRSIVATLTDTAGGVSGRGSAQFAGLATPLTVAHPQVGSDPIDRTET
jgi:acyl-coenzyme A thioesterase PaaI-like protein